MKRFIFLAVIVAILGSVSIAGQNRNRLAVLIEELQGKNGVSFDQSDVSKFFEMMRVNSNDRAVKSAQNRMITLLNWTYENYGYPKNSATFHQLVLALECLREEDVDSGFPPDMGQSQNAFVSSTTRNYLILNILFGNNVIQYLYDEFNILSYGRYSERTLINMCGFPNGTGQPLAIVFMARGDNIGITYRDDLRKFLGNLGKTHDVRIYEFENAREVLQGMERITSRCGRKCNLPVFVSHGEMYALRILSWSDQGVYITGKEEELKKCQEYLSDNADGITNACWTGWDKEDGFAQTLADLWGIPVYAPMSPTDAVSSVEFQRDANGNIRIRQVIASGGELRKFLPRQS